MQGWSELLTFNGTQSSGSFAPNAFEKKEYPVTAIIFAILFLTY